MDVSGKKRLQLCSSALIQKIPKTRLKILALPAEGRVVLNRALAPLAEKKRTKMLLLTSASCERANMQLFVAVTKKSRNMVRKSDEPLTQLLPSKTRSFPKVKSKISFRTGTNSRQVCNEAEALPFHVRCHCVREHVEDGIAKIVFVKSKDNRSDVHTKNTSQGICEEHAREHLKKSNDPGENQV
jgi:uncharacterized protein YpmB